MPNEHYPLLLRFAMRALARHQKTVALLKTLAMQIKCSQKLESRREKWKLNFIREKKNYIHILIFKAITVEMSCCVCSSVDCHWPQPDATVAVLHWTVPSNRSSNRMDFIYFAQRNSVLRHPNHEYPKSIPLRTISEWINSSMISCQRIHFFFSFLMVRWKQHN